MSFVPPHTLAKYANTYNRNGRIGIYTSKERAAMIARFKVKRERRTWRKKVSMYALLGAVQHIDHCCVMFYYVPSLNKKSLLLHTDPLQLSKVACRKASPSQRSVCEVIWF